MYLHGKYSFQLKDIRKNKLSVLKLPFLPICSQTSWSPRETVSCGRDTAALVISSVPRVIFPVLFRLIYGIQRYSHMDTPTGVGTWTCALTHSHGHLFSQSSSRGKKTFSELQALLAYSALSVRRMEIMRQIISNSLLSGFEICIYDVPQMTVKTIRMVGPESWSGWWRVKALQLWKSLGQMYSHMASTA